MQGACENTTNSLNNGDDNSEIIKLVEESHNSVVGPGSKGASQSHSGQTKTRKDEISRGKGKELLDNEILPKCKRLLINAKEQDRSFFKLLSPHISDSQCQIHSVFILGMLLNCYNSKEFSYDIERLRDERLLSYAVLFSLLKHEAKDKTGLITYNRSLPDLGEITTQSGTKISVRCQQRSIVKAKQEFNLKSINNMKSLATGKFKEILDNCNAAIRHSGKELKLLPCYATFRVTLRYMEEKNLPIIISLVRIRKMNKETVLSSS